MPSICMLRGQKNYPTAFDLLAINYHRTSEAERSWGGGERQARQQKSNIVIFIVPTRYSRGHLSSLIVGHTWKMCVLLKYMLRAHMRNEILIIFQTMCIVQMPTVSRSDKTFHLFSSFSCSTKRAENKTFSCHSWIRDTKKTGGMRRMRLREDVCFNAMQSRRGEKGFCKFLDS